MKTWIEPNKMIVFKNKEFILTARTNVKAITDENSIWN
jgi:hypothetical protein